MKTLDNKVAVITGGGSGIGAEIARLFAQHGAKIAILDRDAAAGDGVVGRLQATGTVAIFRAVDVTSSESMRIAFDSIVDELGGIDILVTAAGILDEKPFVDMTEHDFDRTIDIDLKGVFLAGRWAVDHMKQRGGGRIINIASQLGIKGGTGLVHYVAAKAGVIGMTKAMALELAGENILVNAIAPGPIETPLLNGVTEEWKKAKQKELPLGRFGTPAEIAPTALLLASSPGGDIYVGQTLGPNSGDVMP
ncbi:MULTISPECIES: SDR family NAD(P)-dependent oxidoreductase [Micrococcaceae]|uniref:SDR family oxidoreductase n=2 Tax=Glutamicibacter TaxID=1742989 RepID=A0A6H0SLJ7_9MICC|nr:MULTISPECIES: SDR family NAD(P)-dependent oxidoreductase [Micrococcaceae]KSU66001.1 3-oxoacyl-ACP reductase [Arthrobacter sp. NIO-1057]QIV86857.1 SDR family oxidoreductase [Glutamicibacter mishrai]SCC29578.1 3-oxoacyl-[acyl-carrier protein] reductase [Arthrobacter sp. NIO-1057]